MPSLGVRRKVDQISNNNNIGEKEDVSVSSPPQAKIARTGFYLESPKRATIVGKVLVCGQGDMGQLGLGNDESKFERKRPALVDIPNAVNVKAGGMHNLVLTSNGEVYSFGCNDEGALGRDTSVEDSEFTPLPIALPGKVIKVSAGDSHSACLLEDGRVFAWGSFRNSHGNMGLTLDGNKREPYNLLPTLQFVDIASGVDHLVLLTNGGKVFTIGCGEQGQLGRVAIRSASGDSRRGKTELLVPNEVHIRSRKPIVEIWATPYCTFVREHKTDKIFGFGLNNYRQLAVVKKKDEQMFSTPVLTSLTNVKQIAGGQHHTLVLTRLGEVYVIGRRDYGRLGLGEVENDVQELTLVEGLKDKFIEFISCGETQSFAISKNGELFAWGMGSSYQLGTGEEDDALTPVHIVSAQTKERDIIACGSGGQHSIFLAKDKSNVAVVKPNTNKE